MTDPFEDYQAGRIDFGGFERATRHSWSRLARMILARWRAPTYVTEQDLIQEMMIAAYSFTMKWEPRHGIAVRRYVTWNAIDKARKWLHKQRRAGHDGGRGHSAFDLPFSSLQADDETRVDLLDLIAEPVRSEQESAAAYRQAIRQYAGAQPVLQTLEKTGSVDAAAERILTNQRSSEWFGGVTSLADAREKVCCMIETIAEQVTL